jgi:hypothetical protein
MRITHTKIQIIHNKKLVPRRLSQRRNFRKSNFWKKLKEKNQIFLIWTICLYSFKDTSTVPVLCYILYKATILISHVKKNWNYKRCQLD